MLPVVAVKATKFSTIVAKFGQIGFLSVGKNYRLSWEFTFF
jgi:hypothetical protein